MQLEANGCGPAAAITQQVAAANNNMSAYKRRRGAPRQLLHHGSSDQRAALPHQPHTTRRQPNFRLLDLPQYYGSLDAWPAAPAAHVHVARHTPSGRHPNA
jgi:hypothetical protein